MTATFADCEVWQGATHEGYPVRMNRRAHREAFTASGGVIPAGHVLHHLCGEKLCVNVAHLVPLTPSAHMRLHRSWERSIAARLARLTCKHGHPLDGMRRARGRPAFRYCRTCDRGYKIAKRAMMLAETVDEQPAESLCPSWKATKHEGHADE